MTRRASIGITLSAALVLLGTLPGSAAFPGQNGRIVYVSGVGGAAGDDSGADVYITDTPGVDGVAFDTRSGQHRHPAWSPDLTRVAYALFNTPSDEKIWVHRLAGGIPDRLGMSSSNIRNDRPSWSPDGTRIAYESEVTDGSLQSDIIVTDISGGFPGVDVNLTNTPNFTDGKPVWSPDGQWIYFHRNLGLINDATPDEDIMRVRSDGSSPFPEFVVNSAFPEYQVAFSPNGKRICYTRGKFGTADADVYVLTLGQPGPGDDLSDTAEGAYNCAWSPDGKQITYVVGLFSGGRLVVEPVTDTGPTLLVSDTPSHFDGNPDWAPLRPPFCEGRPATIAGTDAGEVINGTSGRDIIAAHRGNDTVRGRGGKDLICGGKGGDRLEGGEANDRLLGGGGIDTCIGGPGIDTKRSCER